MVLPEQAVTATGAENNRFFNVILLAMIFVLFMLVFFGMFGYLMMRVNWRIKRIVQKLEREGIENIGAREPAEQSEVYQLENHIDRMIAKAKDLMQETFAARLEKQEAELRSLQAQINPHFLYNTLDNISWMAVRANAPDICGMIQTLSQYFRLSLSGGKDIVTVEDELELARVYIEIQNSRFRGIIAADIEVPASMRACSIPKLTLQPLLENAVIHGLQPKDDKAWRLRIRGEEQGDTLLFYVEDNGVGMTEEKVESLLRFQPGPGGHGYGLYNVNKRLQLYCGEAFGLRIQSWPGRGPGSARPCPGWRTGRTAGAGRQTCNDTHRVKTGACGAAGPPLPCTGPGKQAKTQKRKEAQGIEGMSSLQLSGRALIIEAYKDSRNIQNVWRGAV